MTILDKRHITATLLTAGLGVALCLSCSTDGTDLTPAPTAITLGADVQGADVTRANSSGCINYPVLAHQDYGFGVFAYGGTTWSNKQVTYKGSETDPVDNLKDVHMHPGNWYYDDEEDWPKTNAVSFLAYAPYVETAGTTGITSVSGTTVDNTQVTYTVGTSVDKAVDLLWGVKGTTGRPWLNATLQDTGGPVVFTFHHALAAIGFHVQTMIDQTNDTDDFGDVSDADGILGTHAKVTIDEVTITGNFHPGGTLNLNNHTGDGSLKNAPRWTATTTPTAMTFTVAESDIATPLRWPEGLAKDAIQQMLESTAMTGVTQEARQLLIKPNGIGAEQCFFVLPTASQNCQVTIKWRLSGTTAEGVYKQKEHSQTFSLTGWQLRHDTKYYLNFVIGLRTVRLDVEAADWDNQPLPVVATIERGTSASNSLAPRR